MKRLILLLLFFVTCSVASYGQITFSSLTEISDGSVDTSAQIVLVNPTSNIPVWRGSVGELLKAISRVGEVIATGSIIDGTITNADISSSANIGIGKLDTTSADGVVSKSRLSNALDDVSGGGLTTIDTNAIFATTLTFDKNKQIGTYTVSGNVTFTVDETGAVPGAFSTIRMNFGPDSLYSINFSGSEFDSVQFFNIASGDTLVGYHIVGFEYTKWGVAVYVPTNQTSGISETIDEGGGGSFVSTLDSLGSLAFEFDSRFGVDTVGGTLTWTDRKNSVVATADSPYGGTWSPTIDGDTLTNSDNTVLLKMDSIFTVGSATAFTIGFAGSVSTADDNAILGDTATTNYLNILIRASSIVSTIFVSDISGYTQTTGNHTFMLVCTGASCTFYEDNVLIGTKAQQTGDKTISWLLEWFSKTTFDGWSGKINQIFLSNKEFSTSDRNAWFDDVNADFNLGL
jgi:hypothetical protein